MPEKTVPHPKDLPCPSCRDGKLHSAARSFEWICIGGCGQRIEKKCPCYFEKELCKGCHYYQLCSHRPSASKGSMTDAPLD